MSNQPSLPASIRFLEQQKVPFRLFHHQRPVESLEDAAVQRGQSPEQVIRSILFRLSEQRYFMVIIPGPNQIPWKALRDYWQQSRLTLASREEVLQVTGCEPGTVNPFGLDAEIPVLIENCIFSLPEISLGSGERGTAILIHPQDVLRAVPQAIVVTLDDALC